MQVACRLLDVSESGFYHWKSRPPSQRAIRHAWLTDQIRAVHAASRGTYGAPRVHAELTLGLGIDVGYNQVELLMARAGIKGLPGVKRARPRHQTPTAGDLVNRAFTRSQPNQLWVTDITEHYTQEGKVYCAVVLDTHSRRVVGWSIDSTQTAALVTNALGMAISNRSPEPGTIIHSDHGVQGGFNWSLQHYCCSDCRCSVIASAGVRHPRTFLGRLLSVWATAESSSGLHLERSVPFGKYCLRSPFVFSFVPRCHGL